MPTRKFREAHPDRFPPDARAGLRQGKGRKSGHPEDGTLGSRQKHTIANRLHLTLNGLIASMQEQAVNKRKAKLLMKIYEILDFWKDVQSVFAQDLILPIDLKAIQDRCEHACQKLGGQTMAYYQEQLASKSQKLIFCLIQPLDDPLRDDDGQPPILDEAGFREILTANNPLREQYGLEPITADDILKDMSQLQVCYLKLMSGHILVCIKK